MTAFHNLTIAIIWDLVTNKMFKLAANFNLQIKGRVIRDVF